MGVEVPRTRTPVSRDEAARALVAAYSAQFGALPSRQAAELLLAQIWLETARGQSLICHNAGNITANAKWPGDFWRPPWFTITESSSARDRDLHEKMRRGQAPSAFRAYGSAAEGFADYVRQLARSFRSVITAAESGDPEAFAEAVQSSNYCPDCDPVKTGPSFRSLQREFQAAGVFDSLPLAPSPGAAVAPAASLPPLASSPLPGHFSSFGGAELPVLRPGAAGQGVLLAQLALGLELTGRYGEEMRQRVRELQHAERLAVDAVIGPRTWGALVAKLSREVRRG